MWILENFGVDEQPETEHGVGILNKGVDMKRPRQHPGIMGPHVSLGRMFCFDSFDFLCTFLFLYSEQLAPVAP